MGTYYQYVNVHGRILIWWSDSNGTEHSKWIDDEEAVRLYGALNKLDMQIQRELAAAVKQST